MEGGDQRNGHDRSLNGLGPASEDSAAKPEQDDIEKVRSIADDLHEQSRNGKVVSLRERLDQLHGNGRTTLQPPVTATPNPARHRSGERRATAPKVL